jgi:hypothetical protein
MNSPEDLIAGAGRPSRLRIRPSGAGTQLAKAQIKVIVIPCSSELEVSIARINDNSPSWNSVLQITAVWIYLMEAGLFFAFQRKPDVHFSASPDYHGSLQGQTATWTRL